MFADEYTPQTNPKKPNNRKTHIIGGGIAVLDILGIVTDPTTAGVSDSVQAMTYDEPKKKNADF